MHWNKQTAGLFAALALVIGAAAAIGLQTHAQGPDRERSEGSSEVNERFESANERDEGTEADVNDVNDADEHVPAATQAAPTLSR